jgi:PST family polysaccharide transporter
MLKYGGTVTVNSVISYLTNNADKVLLGRFWGPEALGIYGRAYQLINIPSDNLNATLGLVAFPAWSRVQNDPSRLRSHFLRGYGLFLSLVLPITLACGMFAEDIVRVFLGPQWSGAAPIFRLMVPTVLVFALINPLGWLMLSLGYATRSLRIASLVAPVLLLGYAIGLRQGPHGVAAGFSISMVLLAIPVIVWCKYGTLISNSDVLKVIAVPLISAVGGALIVWGLGGWLRQVQPAFLRLVMESIVLFSVHLVILLLVLKQKSVYLDLLRCSGLWPLGFVSAHRGEKSSR